MANQVNTSHDRTRPSVLVVGGGGYIGSHMLLLLQEADWNVTVFDNLSRGFVEVLGTVPLVIGDLRNPEDLDACFSENNFDLVMHFAAFAYVGESMQHPHLYYQNNVVGTLNLLETMRRYDVKRLVFFIVLCHLW